MIDFLKCRFVYLIISTVIIVSGLFSIVKWGYIYSIDFVGGTNLQYEISPSVPISQIQTVLKENGIAAIEIVRSGNTVTIRSKPIDEKIETFFKKSFEKKLKTKITTLRSETVGPTLGKETVTKTIIASVLATIGILLYMSYAFKGFTYAFSAIVAMLHDLLVVLGTYSLFSHFFRAEVDTMFVTAVLTSMSFSVHDTIVIFDKIREYKKQEGQGEVEYYANRALTETMVRSVNNSMTIVFMLLALALLGGATIRFFVVTLLVGTVTGTYSSPFVATPILVWLEKRKKGV